MSQLEGKVILVTGASRGIGEEISRYFAALGASTVMMARNSEALKRIEADIREGGGEAIISVGDVASFADVSNAVDTAVSKYGKLDILVNNAGLIDPIAHIDTSDPDAWGQVVDVNLKGVYHGIRAAASVMQKNQGGQIINISSGAATSFLEGWSHYCAAKAAVLSLTGCANKELSPKGISVVGLSPGTVATEMQVSIRKSGINPVSQLDPDVHISPIWVAKAVEYLVTGGAEEYAGTDFSLKTDDGRQKVGMT